MTGMEVLQYGNLRIDPNERRVYVNEQVVELTTMEFNILYYLALYPGWTFTREQPDLQDTEKTKYQCDSNCTWIRLSLSKIKIMAVNRLLLITAIILYLPVTDASQLPLCVEIKIFDISHPFVVIRYVSLVEQLALGLLQ